MNANFQRAIAAFDDENAKDPNREQTSSGFLPRELLYARRLSDWVLKLDPSASEALLLAARSQHLCRWKVPRANYPPNRAGYHRWKGELKRFHAGLAEGILRECGYDEGLIVEVRALILKSNFPTDPASRTLEDALCLVFLEFQLPEFAAKTEPAKVVNALRKSWAKMTERGKAAARELRFGDYEAGLVREALAGAVTS